VNKSFVGLLAAALLAAAAGYFAAMQFAPQPGPDEANGGPVGKPRPDFRHVDLAGDFVDASDFDGNVLLVNFWASWCQPCVEEMPMLSKLQQRYAADGFQVVGIALDDPDRAAAFAAGMNLAYPVLLGEADTVVTGRRYGNASGMLPYSVLVDQEGTISWVRLGALDERSLDLEVNRLLRTD
jgi:thiol-disulfide isomerase/thioredoxin